MKFSRDRDGINLPKQDNYEVAYRIAREELIKKDLGERSLACGGSYREGSLEVKFLNRLYRIASPRVEVSLVEETDEEVQLWEKILILHYINCASGRHPTGELITFGQVPSGAFYKSAFDKRATLRLISAFGENPELLVRSAELLGGFKVDYGDVAVTIPAFPRIPITIVLWRGDDEFPPAGKILFDSTVSEYLPTEDIAVLSSMIVSKLKKLA